MSVGVHQIHQWENEHPDQVNKVPIKTGSFHVAFIVASLGIDPRDDSQYDDASDDVSQVQARNAEERRPKLRRASGRVVEQSPAFTDQLEPFPKMQSREDSSQK